MGVVRRRPGQRKGAYHQASGTPRGGGDNWMASIETGDSERPSSNSELPRIGIMGQGNGETEELRKVFLETLTVILRQRKSDKLAALCSPPS